MPEAHGHGHKQFIPGIIGCFNVAVRGREEESMNGAEYIGRQEVMKAIAEEYNRKGTNDGLKLAWIEKAVNSVPAWIPIEKELPPDDDYILMSYENFTIPDIGRCEIDPDDGSRVFYPGDDTRSCLSFGLFVNAWMPLPKCYED